MKRYIWDTGALSLYFGDHEKAIAIMNDIRAGGAEGYISTSILSEFYYKAIQKYGKKAAQVQVITIMNSKLKEITITSENIFKIGELKVKYTKLSYIDSVVVALGLQQKATLLTTDNYIKNIKIINTIKFEY